MSRDVAGNDSLALTLGSIYATATPAPTTEPPPSQLHPSPPPVPTRRRLNNAAVVPRKRHQRGNSEGAVPDGVGDPALPAPFPWATGQPVRHYTLETLLRRSITTVEGEARCKRCNCKSAVAYDLQAKFREVSDYLAANQHAMNDRAPVAWMNPALPDCGMCGEKRCMWPVIAAKMAEINWLFLLLGKMLGCCTLEQLKYFCKNTGWHRTGVKDRVLYYVFLEMCKQLEPYQHPAP